MKHIILEIAVKDEIGMKDTLWIREALGECARSLEVDALNGRVDSLVPDRDDPGRFTWRSFTRTETYHP